MPPVEVLLVSRGCCAGTTLVGLVAEGRDVDAIVAPVEVVGARRHGWKG